MSKNKSLKLATLTIFIGLFIFLTLGYAIASSITADRVIDLVNQARNQAGFKPLQENSKLSAAAENKAEDMIKNDYFAHNSPGGKTPWYWMDKSGYDYKYAGENLAMNFTSAEDEQKAWMKSESHKKNILNDNFREIGVAVKEGKIDGQSTTIVVQMFGASPVVAPLSEKAPAKAAEVYKPEVLGQEENKIAAQDILAPPQKDMIIGDLPLPMEKAGSVSAANSFWASLKGRLQSFTQTKEIAEAALITLWIILIGNIFFLTYSFAKKFTLALSKKEVIQGAQKIAVKNLEKEVNSGDVSIPIKINILHLKPKA